MKLSTSAKVSLPRGLRLFKMRRPGLPARGEGAVPAGKKPWDVWPGEYFPDFYYRIDKVGLPSRKGTTGTPVFRDAVVFAKREFEILSLAKSNKRAELLAGLAGKRKVGTLGEIFAAYRAGPQMAKDGDRIVRECRRVVAMARGWIKAEEVMPEQSDVAKRIDGLEGSVLSRETVRAYFTICQGGVYKPTVKDRGHITINKRLRMARQLFTARALELCYDGVVLPELDGFMKFPGLRESSIDLEEEMIAPEDYKAMLDASDTLGSECEMVLVNRALRELGLRNGELLAATANWLVRDKRSGNWFLDVRDRPEEGYEMKGVVPGKLPLSVELLAALGRRAVYDVKSKRACFLILPEGLATHRHDMIYREHNAWLKTFIGEIHSGKVNHRLRKYVATMIAEQCEDGVSVSAQYLRHAGEVVALKNYIAKRKERLPVVTDAGLRAWGAAG